MYCGGMEKRHIQCPNCNGYKVRSVSGYWAAMALMSVLFVVTLFLTPVFGVLSLATLGRYRCNQCGWRGKKASLSTNNEVYV
jgi:DNA-directed RNA polymerase subunit RPC12/RpoP